MVGNAIGMSGPTYARARAVVAAAEANPELGSDAAALDGDERSADDRQKGKTVKLYVAAVIALSACMGLAACAPPGYHYAPGSFTLTPNVPAGACTDASRPCYVWHDPSAAAWAAPQPAAAANLASTSTASALTYLDFEKLAFASGDRTQMMDAEACGRLAGVAMDLYAQVRGMMLQLHIPFETAVSQARIDPTVISADDFRVVAAWTKDEIRLDNYAGTPMLAGAWDNATEAWTLCFGSIFRHDNTPAGKAAWSWSQRMFELRSEAAQLAHPQQPASGTAPPSQPAAQPPAAGTKRSTANRMPQATPMGVPIEKDAVLTDTHHDTLILIDGLVRVVTTNGYSCNSISSFSPYVFSRGFELWCNQFAYKYDFEDKGRGYEFKPPK